MSEEDDGDPSVRNREAWDALYGESAELVWGDRPIGFLGGFLRTIEADLGRGARILDAGTGEGRNLPALLRLSEDVHAADSSAHALAKIPREVRERVSLHRAPLDRLPLPDETFDLVLLADVIETLPEPEPVLRELYRVLRPGGRLLCNIPGLEDEISSVDMTLIGPGQFLYRNRYFYRFLGRSEAVDLLRRQRFVVLRDELCHWTETRHPGFREVEHAHTSRVFLVERPRREAEGEE